MTIFCVDKNIYKYINYVGYEGRGGECHTHHNIAKLQDRNCAVYVHVFICKMFHFCFDSECQIIFLRKTSLNHNIIQFQILFVAVHCELHYTIRTVLYELHYTTYTDIFIFHVRYKYHIYLSSAYNTNCQKTYTIQLYCS